MNISNFVDVPNTPPSPASDEKVVRLFQRPRFQTDDTLLFGNNDDGFAIPTTHHIHTMSEENPFLPTDDDIAEASDVSSVSNDSLKRYQNWIPPTQGVAEIPFVPPQEIVVTIKHSTNNDASVPDWLRTSLRDPSPHGPPPAAFAHLSHPLFSNPPSPATQRPLVQVTGHSRSKSWVTESTLTASMNFGAPPSPLSSPVSPGAFDRPQRREQRGSLQIFNVGDLVGQSSFGQDSFSAPTTASSSLSFSGDSFSHFRRANRKLDELVAEPARSVRRNNPLKEEVLFVFDKFSGPVKRMVKPHKHSKSYDLQFSERGCLA